MKQEHKKRMLVIFALIALSIFATSVSAAGPVQWGTQWKFITGNFVIIFAVIVLGLSITPGLKEQLQPKSGWGNIDKVGKYVTYGMIAALSLILAINIANTDWLWKVLFESNKIGWLFYFNGSFTFKPLANIIVFTLFAMVLVNVFGKKLNVSENKTALTLLIIVLGVMLAHNAAFEEENHVDRYIWKINAIDNSMKFLWGGEDGYYESEDQTKLGVLRAKVTIGQGNLEGTHYPLGVLVFATALYFWLFTQYIKFESPYRQILAIYLAAIAANTGTALTTVASIAYIVFIMVLKNRMGKEKGEGWGWAFAFAIVDTIFDTIKIGGKPLTPAFAVWLNEIGAGTGLFGNPFIMNMLFGYAIGWVWENTAAPRLDIMKESTKSWREARLNKMREAMKKDPIGYFDKTSPVSKVFKWLKDNSIVFSENAVLTREMKKEFKQADKKQKEIDKLNIKNENINNKWRTVILNNTHLTNIQGTFANFKEYPKEKNIKKYIKKNIKENNTELTDDQVNTIYNINGLKKDIQKIYQNNLLIDRLETEIEAHWKTAKEKASKKNQNTNSTGGA